MKINPFGRVNANPYTKQVEKQEKLEKTTKSDQLQISSEALKLQKMGSLEKARQEKVEAIKAKVQSDQYEINPKEVAKKMYEFWDKN